MHVQFLGRNPASFEQKGISFENLLTIKKSYLKAICIFVLEMIEFMANLLTL